MVILSPDEYADLSDKATLKQGFFDRMIANQIERFGVMAHVYSAYESRHVADETKPFVRGIKSFELLNAANRWYIVQVYYDRERPADPLPEAYLHDHDR